MLSALSRRAPLRALSIFLGCNLLAGLSPTLQAAGEPAELLDLCRPDSLPQDIRSSLARNFSGWKIQEPTDLSTRARTRWGAQRPLNCPGIANGHFQDAKSASFALVLIPTNRSSNAYRLLIFTQQSGQQFYGFKAVAQTESGAGDVYVETVPTARFPDATAKPVVHSHVTEAVMLVDSATTQSYIYVYSGTAYEREEVTYQ
jgi:hypothetical protein